LFTPKGYIAFLVNNLDKGGLEQVIALLAQRMKERGLHIKILCTSSGGVIADQLSQKGIDVVVFNNDEIKFKKFLKQNKPAIISSHYIQNFYDIPKSLGIPIVETIHNMYAFFADEEWKRETIRARNFDAMIAVSASVKEYYVRHSPSYHNNIEVVGNAADINRINNDTKYLLRRELGVPLSKHVFLNISSYDGRKNHIGLLTAFEQFYTTQGNHSFLIFAGNILDEGYYDSVKKYITTLNAKNNILCLDYTSNVGSLLNMADTFIISSFLEGWSISATEAAYAGLPIIHSDCGSGKELCGDENQYGILVPNPLGAMENLTLNNIISNTYETNQSNVSELHDAMVEMYKNKEHWDKKRPIIRSRALTEFNVDNMVARYLDVFERVAK